MSNEKSTALVSVEAFEQRYPGTSYNRLLPSTQVVESVQKYSKLTIETVTINPDPDQQEVFSLGRTRIPKLDAEGNPERDNQGNEIEIWVDKLSPTKTALDKLTFAMGIESVPEKSGRQDDRSDRDYFEWKSVARVTKPDGTQFEVSATKVIDVKVHVEELFENLNQQHESGNLGSWSGSGKNRKMTPFSDAQAVVEIEKRCRNREIELRKHGLAQAETGANNRLVRKVSNLKPWYTKEELAKPFVVARIDRNVAEIAADPKTRGEVIREGSHAASQVFESQQAAPAAGANIREADFSDVSPEGEMETEQSGPTPDELRKEFEQQVTEMDTKRRFDVMIDFVEKRQIKVEGSGELLNIEYDNWEKRNAADQVKNLMWAFDHSKPDGLPH